ncbi:hypothetical protein IFM89_034650 [Coptis chinensis]|uniref:Exostosin GT47 domain-containing protein n=1 Tax=Coptis chinensis TaxID=261450 RepID=A0A835HPC4_9MAGN|nr:hypothetical protein IFM89_034650 [Coptis chinensis]
MAGKSTQIPTVLITLTTLITFLYLSFKSLLFPLDYYYYSTTTPPPITSQHVLSDLYHSPQVFKLNYEEMEKKFKVYIYPDGDPNTFYQTPRKLTGKYSSEGYFFQNIRESMFTTNDPDEAHLFFIPISAHKMRGKGTSYENMTVIVDGYVKLLMRKYPYWNRTLGADHFFVTCHDVGVRATEGVEYLVKNSIRVVCSPSYNVGFIPHKDVALPQVLQPFPLPRGGNDLEKRKIGLKGSLLLQRDLRTSLEGAGILNLSPAAAQDHIGMKEEATVGGVAGLRVATNKKIGMTK